jgi:hypothetical protein
MGRRYQGLLTATTATAVDTTAATTAATRWRSCCCECERERECVDRCGANGKVISRATHRHHRDRRRHHRRDHRRHPMAQLLL